MAPKLRSAVSLGAYWSPSFLVTFLSFRFRFVTFPYSVSLLVTFSVPILVSFSVSFLFHGLLPSHLHYLTPPASSRCSSLFRSARSQLRPGRSRFRDCVIAAHNSRLHKQGGAAAITLHLPNCATPAGRRRGKYLLTEGGGHRGRGEPGIGGGS